MECAAAWDGNPNTDPWTDLITAYIPWQVALAVFGALVVWVPVHFIVAYRRRARRQVVRPAVQTQVHPVASKLAYDVHEAALRGEPEGVLDVVNKYYRDNNVTSWDDIPEGQGQLF
jgi:hypothetical protein